MMKLLSCSTNTFVSIGEKLAKEIDPVDISPTQQVKQAESKFKFRKISSIEVFNMLKKMENQLDISYVQQSSENCERPQRNITC